MTETSAIAVRPRSVAPQASFTSRNWPGPVTPAGPVPLAAAIAAGVLTAGLVPLGRTGAGWTLAGIVVCAGTAAGLWRPGGAANAPGGAANAPDGWRRLETVAWALVALVLLTVGGLRAAGWLFGLCLLAAAAATVLAATGGRSVRGLALGALLVPAAAWRGVDWARGGVAGWRHRLRPTVRLGPTIAVTAVVLVLFGALFASADATFSRLLGYAVPDVPAGSLPRWAVLFVAGAALVLAVVFLLLAPPTVDGGERAIGPASGRGVRLAEWVIPVAALVVLFAGFVTVQLAVLFGGTAYVLGPDGPDYADHARGGFWQLLTVTLLTLVVIGVVARLAPRYSRPERWCLRLLLGALASLTLVIVASALFRMQTYQEAYGFTRLRVVVSVVELWLGLVFVLVLAAGIRLRARWLPRAVVATGVLAVLALATLNPDRFIAERNLDRWAGGTQLDVAYLAGLSADAVPALVCLPEPERTIALRAVDDTLAGSAGDWRRGNLSEAIARDLLADLAIAEASCRAGGDRVPSSS